MSIFKSVRTPDQRDLDMLNKRNSYAPTIEEPEDYKPSNRETNSSELVSAASIVGDSIDRLSNSINRLTDALLDGNINIKVDVVRHHDIFNI